MTSLPVADSVAQVLDDFPAALPNHAHGSGRPTSMGRDWLERRASEDLSAVVAKYLGAVEHAEQLPSYAYPNGLFTSARSTQDVIGSDPGEAGMLGRLAHLSPIDEALALGLEEELEQIPGPDGGRRIQFWPEVGPSTGPHQAFEARVQWVGRLTAVEGDRLSARLRDLSHPGSAEDVSFPVLALLDPGPRSLAIGERLYVTAGYEVGQDGERTAAVRARRMIRPSAEATGQDDRREADSRAQAILGALSDAH